MEEKERINKWINSILNELSKLDSQKGMKIMHNCGAACSTTSNLLDGAINIRNEFQEIKDIDILFKVFKKRYYNSSRLTKNNGIITLIFEECTCPIAKAGINNSYLCNCTTGYTKNIFKTLFNKDVVVQLEESILKGDKICKQIINITH